MNFSVASFFTSCFCFAFLSFLAVHYTHMKAPSQNREIANWVTPAPIWYDASYKF